MEVAHIREPALSPLMAATLAGAATALGGVCVVVLKRWLNARGVRRRALSRPGCSIGSAPFPRRAAWPAAVTGSEPVATRPHAPAFAQMAAALGLAAAVMMTVSLFDMWGREVLETGEVLAPTACAGAGASVFLLMRRIPVAAWFAEADEILHGKTLPLVRPMAAVWAGSRPLERRNPHRRRGPSTWTAAAPRRRSE